MSSSTTPVTTSISEQKILRPSLCGSRPHILSRLLQRLVGDYSFSTDPPYFVLTAAPVQRTYFQSMGGCTPATAKERLDAYEFKKALCTIPHGLISATQLM